MAARGRPSDYTQKLADEICQRIAIEGKSIQEIGLQKDMPVARTIHRWIAKREDFSQAYARARKQRGHVLFEEAIELADECPLDKDAAAAYRLRVETRKWAAARLNTEYGEKIQVDANLTGNLAGLLRGLGDDSGV